MTASATVQFRLTEKIEPCKIRHAESTNFSAEDLARWSQKPGEWSKQTLSLENGQTNYPMSKDFDKRV